MIEKKSLEIFKTDLKEINKAFKIINRETENHVNILTTILRKMSF